MQQDRSTENLTKAFQVLEDAQEVLNELWEAATSDPDAQIGHHEMVLATKARTYVTTARFRLARHAKGLGCPEIVPPGAEGLQPVGGDAA